MSDPVWSSGNAIRVLAAAAAVLAALPAAAFDLQGHRGARGLAPENTIAGFRTALEFGVTTLELDTGITRDGVVVVSHDPALNPDLTRDARGNWLEGEGPPLHSLPYAEVARYDVGRLRPGTRYAQRYPQQTGRDAEPIPRLADVLDLVADKPVRLNIEVKVAPGDPAPYPGMETLTRAAVALVSASPVADRVTLQSFDWAALRLAKELAPALPTACLSAQQRWLDNIRRGQPGASPWTAGLDIDEAESLPALVKSAGCSIWSPYHGDLSREQVDAAHALGLQVLPWTVNDTARIGELIDMGVDGVISDRPDLAREAMAAKGLPLPPPVRP